MKIGIIQTRGLGDIVIAAPIAMYYIERGCEVYWPIDSEFLHSFKDAFPKIRFMPIERSITGDATAEYFYHTPLRELQRISCESIICLYSQLTGFDFGQPRLQESLSFDAYKYALAKVPFREKWQFHPKRNLLREANIFKLLELDPNQPYNVIHEEGSNFKCDLSSHIKDKEIRNIRITSLSNNIFDWISVLENCQAAYLVDSVYVNLIEQLNMKIEKTVFLRSNSAFTPTLQNSWNFV
jgi:hypothetical protein